MQSIRSLIAVDGSHLKGKYKGTMLVTTSLDMNNQIYLIAIGIVDLENDASWEWFMTNLRGVIRDVPELAFIFYRYTFIGYFLVHYTDFVFTICNVI